MAKARLSSSRAPRPPPHSSPIPPPNVSPPPPEENCRPVLTRVHDKQDHPLPQESAKEESLPVFGCRVHATRFAGSAAGHTPPRPASVRDKYPSDGQGRLPREMPPPIAAV